MKHFDVHLTRFAAALLIVVLLTACTENTSDLVRHINAVKSRPVDPIDPIPPVKTYTPYAYEGLIGRDPFRQSFGEGSDDVRSSSDSGPHPDFDRSRQYLERFGLDTLSMVGTFSNEESNWSLVGDPEEVVHRVAVGDYLGKNHGKVVGISNTQISLSELISDGAGGWLLRPATITLIER